MGNDTYPSDVWGHTSGGEVNTDPSVAPPAGALVFWDSKLGRTDSHVAISIGNSELISTNVDQKAVPGYDGIHEESMAQFQANGDNVYLGWWLPDANQTSTSPSSSPNQSGTQPDPVSPPPVSANGGSRSYAIGSTFDDECVVAWPTAPSISSSSIEMTMSCDHVPEGEFLFTDVGYDDPNLSVTPDTGKMHVVGKIIDISQSDYGYKELVVEASRITLNN